MDLIQVVRAGQEHDILLRGVDIVILQEEHLVYAILLESRELDEETERPGQALLNHDVLLSSNLRIPLAKPIFELLGKHVY